MNVHVAHGKNYEIGRADYVRAPVEYEVLPYYLVNGSVWT